MSLQLPRLVFIWQLLLDQLLPCCTNGTALLYERHDSGEIALHVAAACSNVRCAQVYRGLKGGITDVAIKTLLHTDESHHSQFMVEINLLRSLSFDRYIVQFYGACLKGPDPMLILVSGPSNAACVSS